MDIQSTLPHVQFPAHGPIACRGCFLNAEPVMDVGPWRIVNDPGAWGGRPRPRFWSWASRRDSPRPRPRGAVPSRPFPSRRCARASRRCFRFSAF